jgi:hypothetical protein
VLPAPVPLRAGSDPLWAGAGPSCPCAARRLTSRLGEADDSRVPPARHTGPTAPKPRLSQSTAASTTAPSAASAIATSTSETAPATTAMISSGPPQHAMCGSAASRGLSELRFISTTLWSTFGSAGDRGAGGLICRGPHVEHERTATQCADPGGQRGLASEQLSRVRVNRGQRAGRAGLSGARGADRRQCGARVEDQRLRSGDRRSARGPGQRPPWLRQRRPTRAIGRSPPGRPRGRRLT